MKILFITPYITSTCHPALLKNQTGFGYMVHDIAQYVAKTDEVDLFISMAFTPQMEVDGFRIIGRSKWGVLKKMKFSSLWDGISFNRMYRQPFKSRLRTLYIFVSMGQVEHILKLKKYDIVHIHGCSELTDAAIKVCQKAKIPFIVTLHGLNSFDLSIKQNEAMRRYERNFLKEAAVNHYPVSFISTGNKNTAEESTGVKADSFRVVCNGCNTQKQPKVEDVRAEYSITLSDFVFAFVGNISVNKNQIQVARAWKLLPNDLREKCKVLFVGRYKDDDEIVKYICDNHLQNNLILCGIQPKDRVSAFYQACDATILTSITEGFGLSIIEGFVYGKPNVSFGDLPATMDLYDEKVMIVAAERSDKALAETIAIAIKSKFDSNYISNYAQRFSFENMSNEYRIIYNNLIKTNNGSVSV